MFCFALRIEKKQQKITAFHEEEKKLHEFKARPLPNLNKPVNLPIKEVLPLTKPEPFDIKVQKICSVSKTSRCYICLLHLD